MKKKIVSMLLVISLVATMTTSVAAIGETENNESTQLTDKIFSTTVVSQDNGGASTYALNNEPTYTVNLALTDGTEEIEEFTITDTEGQSMESQISNTNDSVQISGLVLDELYVFNSIVDGTPIRGAVETIQDGDIVVATTQTYDFIELELAANNDVSNAYVINNNRTYSEMDIDTTTDTITNDTTESSPGTIYVDRIIRGVVNSSPDLDVYNFTAVTDGRIDVKVLVPNHEGMTLSLYVYEILSNGGRTRVGTSNLNGTMDEYSRVYNVTAGTTYQIIIYSSQTTSNEYYYLQVENLYTKTWFPQRRGYMASAYYWNTHNLENLYYNNGTQFTDNEASGSDGMATACVLTCFSMIYANMGLVPANTMYDFRFSELNDDYSIDYYEGFLSPDPYVLFLVNNYLDGSEVEYNTVTSRYEINMTGLSVGVRDKDDIAYSFYTTYNRIPTSGRIQGINSFDTLKEELDDLDNNILCNSGVILVFEGSSSHAVVVYKDSTTGDYYVSDPGVLDDSYRSWELESYMENNYVGQFKNATERYTDPKYSYSDILCIHYILPGVANE